MRFIGNELAGVGLASWGWPWRCVRRRGRPLENNHRPWRGCLAEAPNKMGPTIGKSRPESAFATDSLDDGHRLHIPLISSGSNRRETHQGGTDVCCVRGTSWKKKAAQPLGRPSLT